VEKLQAELNKRVEALASTEMEVKKPKVSKRKREGTFYKPAYITID
jgi:hypothetical protein